MVIESVRKSSEISDKIWHFFFKKKSGNQPVEKWSRIAALFQIDDDQKTSGFDGLVAHQTAFAEKRVKFLLSMTHSITSAPSE